MLGTDERRPTDPANAGEVAILKGQMEAVIEHGMKMNREIETVRNTARDVIDQHNLRIMALEAEVKALRERLAISPLVGF
jgi:hypothetical protein